MIITQAKLLIAGVSIVAVLGTFTWFYFEGKKEAREECLAEQAKVIQLWQQKLDEVQDQNRELAEHLANTTKQLKNASATSVKRIVKYVETNPDSNTIIFDADGLSILNDAQKGVSTSSK